MLDLKNASLEQAWEEVEAAIVDYVNTTKTQPREKAIDAWNAVIALSKAFANGNRKKREEIDVLIWARVTELLG